MTAWYQRRQPHLWTACSKECAVMAHYLLCAGGLWLSVCSVTILSLTVNTGLSAATAVLLGQSACMPAQMPQSLSNPCSSKHGQSLASTMALAACPFQTVSGQETLHPKDGPANGYIMPAHAAATMPALQFALSNVRTLGGLCTNSRCIWSHAQSL